jgi:hypothetical protein
VVIAVGNIEIKAQGEPLLIIPRQWLSFSWQSAKSFSAPRISVELNFSFTLDKTEHMC